MKTNKPILELSFSNLARIVCISILFIIFGVITYRIPKSLNILDGLSIFAMQFYVSFLQIIIIFLILKYGLKKENKIIKEDEKELEINLFDILIFLFIGLLLENILLRGLCYLESILNISPNYNNDVLQGVLEGMQITNLDKIYSFITGVILAPIVEELFFRKGVFRYFAGKEVTSRSIILISGISFGLTHSMGFAKSVSVIVDGIIFAVIYAVTKDIIYPIIGHGLNNLMPFITTIFRDNSGIEDIETYIEADKLFEIRGAIIISLVLLVITIIISYIKRKTIISSDFKDSIIKVFTE